MGNVSSNLQKAIRGLLPVTNTQGNYATAQYLIKMPTIIWYIGSDGGYYYGRPTAILFRFAGIDGRKGSYWSGLCASSDGATNIAVAYLLRIDAGANYFWVTRR